MATNDILPFATASTNVLTQAEYAADTQRTSGNIPGVARSKLVNKAARQAAFVSAMVGQFTADGSGQDVLDNGDSAGLLANFKTAVNASVSGRLLRTSVYRIISGTQQVSVNGGAFTTTGATTFSTLAQTSQSLVHVMAGGAGGGSCETNGAGARSSGAGGGAGGEAISIVSGSLSNIPVTVGAGGAGAAVGGAGVGGTGGSSSLGSLVSATGGGGGGKGLTTTAFPIISYGGTGGLGSSGNISNSRGDNGGYGLTLAVLHGVSGAGGASSLGGGAAAGASSAGLNAETPGSGGAGAAAAPSSAGNVGGNGASGLVIVKEYA